MGKFSLKMILVLVSGLLLGCSNGPVEYNADNPGGILHQISTDPDEIFRNKVDHEAELEARGVEPPVGNASWREYWSKLIAYYTGEDTSGAHNQRFAGAKFTAGGREPLTRRSRAAGDSVLVKTEVVAYVVGQRRARGLPPL